MSRRVITEIVSDLSGEVGAVCVPVAYDGTAYEIDLTKAEIEELEEILAPYLTRARVIRKTRPSASRPSGVDPKVVRAWAVGHGFSVPPRGRIPNIVVDAYRAAHGLS